MSALPPKADICSALPDVRFGPKADIRAAQIGILKELSIAVVLFLNCLRCLAELNLTRRTKNDESSNSTFDCCRCVFCVRCEPARAAPANRHELFHHHQHR